ncbi:MAG: YeeE/YedE family protein [Pseudomonadota bacterium]
MIFDGTAWLFGVLGGLMIGAAAALFLLGNGRIMGASGLVGGLVDGTAGARLGEGVVFLLALIAVPAVLNWAALPMDTRATADPVLLIGGGVAVGLGTRLANGCTSGHGVCGMSRLSVRGIVATLIYMGAGIATVAALRMVLA